MNNRHVLLAGLFHETHTFLGTTTSLSDFKIRTGNELLAARGDGSPLSGVLEVADECEWKLTPIIDLRATPSGTVTDSVLDTFSAAFEDVARPLLERREVDGIYLILHGAMVCESTLDVEGEVIRRIRALTGASEIPICGVLDLHGNISRDTIELTQGLISYQCNPHTDSRNAAVRGARLLERILDSGIQPQSVWAQPAVIWPPTGTGTADDPMKTLESLARKIEASNDDIFAVNVMGGFGFADTPDSGVSFAAVTFGDRTQAESDLNGLCEWTIANQHRGNIVDAPLDSILADVKHDLSSKRTPVILVEPSDNIGGGSPGDMTDLLRCLLDEHYEDSAAVINDPEAVANLQSVEPGQSIELEFGGKSGTDFCRPITANVKLISRSDGQFDLEDRNSHLASMCGVHIDMGPCATIRVDGTLVLLTSRKTPPFDLGQLRSQGIIPEECSVIAVKAAVAHRRAYDPITASTYTVDTPGPCSSNLKSFPWKQIRRPIYPLDD